MQAFHKEPSGKGVCQMKVLNGDGEGMNMRKSCLLAVLAALMLFASPAIATLSSATCLNSTASNYDTRILTNGTWTNSTQTVNCSLGCDSVTGNCAYYETDFFPIIIGLTIAAFVFMYAASREELSFTMNIAKISLDPVKFLFIGLALFFILMDFGVMMDAARVYSMTGTYGILTPGYIGMSTAFWVLVFVLLITFMFMVFKILIGMHRMRK